jgi:magnesium-dependent phosphatase 1
MAATTNRQPNSAVSTTTPPRQSTTPHGKLYSKLPRVFVFDLDNTIWSPELYQLRHLQRRNQTPVAGKDVKMLEGAIKVLEEIIPTLSTTTEEPPMLAIASRTQSVEWAQDLLDQFDLRRRFHAIEIFPAHKTKHFAKISRQLGVPFHEMIFFDDARDGKYGNCEPVAALGVFCVHCKQGIVTSDIFERALHLYQKEWDKSPNCIVEHDGQLTTNNIPRYIPADRRLRRSQSLITDEKTYEGQVKMVQAEKNYGFIRFRHDGKDSKDVFFHFNNLATDRSVATAIEEGDEVTFQMQVDDRNGKHMAVNVAIQNAHDTASLQYRCFSMNQPFAALLANGYKTLETRNGTMFTQYAEGTQMLLHVGKRTYPDGGKHLEIMAESGLSDEEIEKLKSLPSGFSRGSIVAILELGKTYETTVAQRSEPRFEQGAAARGSDSGKFVTEIRRVAYLKKPVQFKGEPGVFKVNIPQDILPDDDGWHVPATQSTESNSEVYASISG